MAKLTVPEGFVLDHPYNGNAEMAVVSHRAGSASIRFIERKVRLGIVRHGKHDAGPRFGRGWKQALVDDAVKLLRDLEVP